MIKLLFAVFNLLVAFLWLYTVLSTPLSQFGSVFGTVLSVGGFATVAYILRKQP